jgi:hypothetical protein
MWPSVGVRLSVCGVLGAMPSTGRKYARSHLPFHAIIELKV